MYFLETESKLKTCSGGRTSLFIPELNQLIVATPARDGDEAQLMIDQTIFSITSSYNPVVSITFA